MRFDITKLGDFKKNKQSYYSILTLIVNCLSILSASHLSFDISVYLKLCKEYFIVTIFARLNFPDFDSFFVSLSCEAVQNIEQ